ncbi:LysR family transcriptional regulator [Pseudomonas typographi]|uniref:LysR family transcriptional regulator n=1 Tax=Pseudomonas typographi TaxID=2715964 RepID=UPI0016862B54|nr:LysR family transcriptional regulator [Pseudomonas typographi]MBD1554470.1 LysR family transcriptional regulator [Pseudomonas typographi]
MESITDWSLLQTFYLAAKYGNTHASELLSVNITTVRRRLAELEKELTTRLFIRNGRQTLLTEDGQHIYDVVDKMNTFGRDVSLGSVDRSREVEGIIRVSTMDGFGASYLSPRIGEFLARYPNIQVQLVTSPHIVNLAEREADVSINMMSPSAGRLVVKKISDFTVRLYASRDYLRRQGVPESAADLQRHKFITYVDELVSIPYVRWLPSLIPNPISPLVCTSLAAQHSACAAGIGLAMLPDFMVSEREELVSVMPEKTTIIREWWLVVHQDLQKVTRIRAFIDFVYTIMERDRRLLIGDW